MKKIYIAGFDVFYPDAAKRGSRMKMICAEHGFIGLYPLDGEASTAEEIFRGNCARIDEADLVIANMNPFRGAEPDSGTAFEVGYACAKGKKVYLYLSDARAMRDKLGETDEAGFSVENFGLPVNLMLSSAATVVEGDFTAAVKRAKADMTS